MGGLIDKRRLAWGQESGFGLIEVMVSALLIGIIAAATVSSIGFSQKQSGRTLARNITSNLAERDQERMRSMRASDLVDYAATSSVAQGGASYTINSNAVFVQDAGSDTINCSSTGDQAKFLRLTSTVTPPAATDGDPLTVNSLYALPIAQYSATTGTLVVKVVKQDATTPQPSIPVSITNGSTTKTGTTNAAGCVIFQFITPGNWSITLNRSGFVDTNLAQAAVGSGTVTPGDMSSTTLIYEQAGSMSATIDTGGVAQPFDAPGFSVSHTGITTTSKIRTSPSGSPTTITGLFPFTGAYSAYSGTCAANDPSAYDASYYSKYPGFGQGTVTSGNNTTVKLREPPVNATVQVRFYTGTSGAKATTTLAGLPVVLTQTNSGCGSPKYNTTTKADGTLVAPGAPFGDYTVCATASGAAPTSNGGSTNGTWTGTASFQNRAHNGSPAGTVVVDTTGAKSAACS